MGFPMYVTLKNLPIYNLSPVKGLRRTPAGNPRRVTCNLGTAIDCNCLHLMTPICNDMAFAGRCVGFRNTSGILEYFGNTIRKSSMEEQGAEAMGR